jgi:hypothetical protein
MNEQTYCEVIEEKETWENTCNEYLKREINDLLWRFLPPSTRLITAEKFACSIYESIRNRWEGPIDKDTDNE